MLACIYYSRATIACRATANIQLFFACLQFTWPQLRDVVMWLDTFEILPSASFPRLLLASLCLVQKMMSSVWLISSSLHVCLHSSTFSWPVCVVIVMLFLQYLFMLMILVFCTFTVFLCISGNRDEVKRFPCISKKPFPFKNWILLSVPAQSKNDPNSLILKTFHTCNWS